MISILEKELLNLKLQQWESKDRWPCPLCLTVPLIYKFEPNWWQRFKASFDWFNREYDPKLCIRCDCAYTESIQWYYIDLDYIWFKWNNLVRDKAEQAIDYMLIYGFEDGYNKYRIQRDNMYELFNIRHYFKDKFDFGNRDDRIRMAKYLF